MQLVTVGPTTLNDLPQRLRQAESSLQRPVGAVIAYLPNDEPVGPVVQACRQVFSAPVIGACTGGSAFTERGSTHTEICLGLLSDVEPKVQVLHHLSKASQEQIMASAREAAKQPVRINGMMVLADPVACDGESLLDAIRPAVPGNCRVFGCTLGEAAAQGRVRLFVNDEEFHDAAIFVAWRFPGRVALNAMHGFYLPDEARALTVTDCDGRLLRALDQRPAEEVIREELVRLQLMREGDPILPKLTAHPLAVRTPFGEGLKLRAPLSLAERGAIILASPIPIGDQVAVATSSPDRLVEAAALLRDRTISMLPHMSGLLIFDCVRRELLLGEDYEDEVTAFLQGHEAPMLGLGGCGQIAKAAGHADGFHTATSIMVGWQALQEEEPPSSRRSYMPPPPSFDSFG